MREVPSWDEYFMSIAKTVSTRSKDPRTQVGAVIVGEDKRIIGTGYNGMQLGTKETVDIWRKNEKHPYVIHAEVNAILNSVKEVQGATLYVTLKPCPECAKLVGAAGIREVIYLEKRVFDNEPDYERFCPMRRI